MITIPIFARRGRQIDDTTGYVRPAGRNWICTDGFIEAYEGSNIRVADISGRCRLAIYGEEWDNTYVYTYSYQQEENWAIYKETINCEDQYTFKEHCFFRVEIELNEEPEIAEKCESDLLELSKYVVYYTNRPEYKPKECFLHEIDKTIQEVQQACQSTDGKIGAEEYLVMPLLTDTHYVNNGTWGDTAYNLKQTCKGIKADAIMHMGDITDGMVPIAVTCQYTRSVMDDLRENGVPVYILQGNHDSNYFRNNPEKLTDEEQYELYQKQTEEVPGVKRDGHNCYYYVDYPRKGSGIRMFCLTSFDYREQFRYGYSSQLVEWFIRNLNNTPNQYTVLVFSHVPPLPEIHAWSDVIRGSESVVGALEDYQTRTGNVAALIHGHSHADQIYRAKNFPIIGIGCNKCEEFYDHKPEGSITYPRKRNTLSQDLWDVLVVNTKERELSFIRFGAGDNRVVKW